MNAKCLEFWTFLVISRKDFVEMIKKFPNDYEKFKELNDQILI